jgi:hypothetical protein
LSLEELQQAQREQMEDAIGAMARQMKDASQGIQSQLTMQTAHTLSELQDVAETNIQEVTKVVQNVSQHHQNRWKTSLGTWTMILSLVGLFFVTMVIVFTIPKRPNVCLFGSCSSSSSSSKRGEGSSSLLGWMTKPLVVVTQGVVGTTKYLFFDTTTTIDDDDDDDDDDPNIQPSKEDEDRIYQEDEEERLQKEKLAQLLQEMQEEEEQQQQQQQQQKKEQQQQQQQQKERTLQGNQKSGATVDWRDALKDEEQEDDNPWGRKPAHKEEEEDDDDDDTNNPWGRTPIHQDDDDDDDTTNKNDNPWGRNPAGSQDEAEANAKEDDENDNPWGRTPLLEMEEKDNGHRHKTPLEDALVEVESTHNQQQQQQQEQTTQNEQEQQSPPLDPQEDENEDATMEDEEEDAEDNTNTNTTANDNPWEGQKPIIEMEEEELDENPWGRTPIIEEEDEQDAIPQQDGTPDDLDNRLDSGSQNRMEDDHDRNHQGHRPEQPLEDGAVESTHNPQQQEEQTQNEKQPVDPQDVNMDELLASLNKAKNQPTQPPAAMLQQMQDSVAAETADEHLHLPNRFDPKPPQNPKESSSFESNGALARSGTAKLRFTPRDMRVAARMGQHELVQEYLEHHPEYIDRLDKNSWTALHLATRNGETKVVEVLIQHGSNVALISREGYSALDLAVERLGADHEITRLLRESGGVLSAPQDENRQDSEQETQQSGEDHQAGEESHRRPRLKAKQEAKQRALEEALQMAEDDIKQAQLKAEGEFRPTEEDDEEDHDKYIEAGRSRLDAILGSKEHVGRDEL